MSHFILILKLKYSFSHYFLIRFFTHFKKFFMHLLQEHVEPKLSNGISKLNSADLETEGSIFEEFDNFVIHWWRR